MATIYDKMTAIGNAIRAKTGHTTKLSLDEMASNLNNIPTKEASIITPSTINQIIPANTYLTGEQTIIGDSNLIATNIKKDINIFGVIGNYKSIDLNFEVVGGTTQPSNPKENTLWVNTSTTITNWYFSATQPSNAVSGDVWFEIGASSNNAFNALKENTLMVYPVSAKQYVQSGWSGSWNSVNMSIYSNGQWLSGLVYLYNQGNQCTTVTSGWSTKGWDGGGDGDGSTTYNGSNIDVYVYNNSSGGIQIQGAVTGKKINLSNVTKIHAIGNIYNFPTDHLTKNAVGIAVMNTNEFTWTGTPLIPGEIVSYNIAPQKTGNFEIMIDVSHLSSSYYIAIYGIAESRHIGVKFTQIYCE